MRATNALLARSVWKGMSRTHLPMRLRRKQLLIPEYRTSHRPVCIPDARQKIDVARATIDRPAVFRSFDPRLESVCHQSRPKREVRRSSRTLSAWSSKSTMARFTMIFGLRRTWSDTSWESFQRAYSRVLRGRYILTLGQDTEALYLQADQEQIDDSFQCIALAGALEVCDTTEQGNTTILHGFVWLGGWSMCCIAVHTCMCMYRSCL